jgi:4-amino-4-deoxy-L-arabinose transferase-like glycosyltransferase
MKSPKKILPLFLIITLALVLRITNLNQVPPSLANDEANIMLNAQSLLKTGQSIPGVVNGIFALPTNVVTGVHGEISSFILMPWYFIFGFSWPLVKLPFIFASLGIVMMGFLLVKQLINEKAGLIAALFMTVNPWLIHFGRLGYEAILSAFFYLAALYLVISQRKWKILWSIPFFIAGFFCYFSAKTLIIPLGILSFIMIKLIHQKDSIIPATVMNIIIVIFVAIYSILLPQSQSGARLNELKTQDLHALVNEKRTASIESPINIIFENKVLEDLKIRINASLSGLSPSYLFIDGQPESISPLSIPDHAHLYLIDLPLIILGLIYLSRENLSSLVFFIGIIISTLAPNFLNLAGTTYSIRTVLLFPILSMISAVGLYSILTYANKFPIRKITTTLVIAMYFVFFLNFTYQYFIRLPIARSDGYFFEQRVLSNYIKLVQEANPNILINVYTNDARFTFYRYLLFSNNYHDPVIIKEVNKKIDVEDYSFSNLNIEATCPVALNEQVVNIIDTKYCPDASGTHISSIKDSGSEYLITKDILCEGLVNRRYITIQNYQLLNVERLSLKDFCQNYFTN